MANYFAHRLRTALLLVGLTIALNFGQHAFADEKGLPFTKRCSSYSSPKEFVRESNLHCLRQSHSKLCEKQATSYFESCHFKGDYRALNREVSKELLLIFVFGRSPDVARRLDAKS